MTKRIKPESLTHTLIVAGMCGCVALSLADLGSQLLPDWNGAYMVVLSVLAALEAAYSYRLTKARRLHGSPLLRFRAVELGSVYVLVWLATYVGRDWAEVRTWPQHPPPVVTLGTAMTFAVALLCWWAATDTASDMERITEPPELHRGETPPTRAITARFFWGGAFLLLAAGLTRIGIAELLRLEFPPVPGLVLNVLAYFLLGLALLGQAHFVRMRRQWEMKEVDITSGLARRWVVYCLALLIAAGCIALLLPTRYTVGLLDVLRQIVNAVMYVFMLITAAIAYVVSAIAHLIQRLLGRETEGDQIGPLQLPPAQQIEEIQPSGPAPGWLDTLRSIGFWVVALGVIIYLVRTYLRDHPELLDALGRIRIIRGLHNLLAAIWRRLLGLAKDTQARVAARLAQRRAATVAERGGFRLLRPSLRTPRERVLYYYLSTLERAHTLGFPRQPAQTPQEYISTLIRQLPESREDIGVLTQSFVEARYGAHPLDKRLGQQVRASWQRIREALRAKRRGD
ncbi:MAG: DUF4129 domain-containing protein [Anaerolineales bacterium]|nr:DUF4129 domain-containing protein [Anaerolineales bacterium]